MSYLVFLQIKEVILLIWFPITFLSCLLLPRESVISYWNYWPILHLILCFDFHSKCAISLI